jgi:rubrerythrin
MSVDMTVEDILREAIQSEVESYELYTNAVNLVQAAHIKETLRQLAQEELGHKALLEKMLANPGQMRLQVRKLQAAPIQDYGIGDHLKVQPLGPDATFQDVCIFASKKEQESYELYRDMAEQNEGQIRDLLEAMAKDELRHKDLVERWYEEVVYQDF